MRRNNNYVEQNVLESHEKQAKRLSAPLDGIAAHLNQA